MQTANEVFDLRSVQEQLEHLKSGVQTATSSEKALLKTKAERLSTLRREAQRHGESDAEKVSIRIHTLTDEYKERVVQAEANAEARAAWVQRAYHNSKSSLARRIQQAKDSKIGKVQGAIMRNRQAREQELMQATQRHQELLQLLKADRVTRRDLRKAILAKFRTFRPWLVSWFEQTRKKVLLEEASETPEIIHEALQSCLEQIKAESEAAGRLTLVRFFRFIPLSILALVIAIMHVWYGLRAGGGGLQSMVPSLCIAGGILLALWLIAFFSSLAIIRRASVLFGKAILLETAAETQSTDRLSSFSAEIQNVQADEGRELSETFRLSDDEWRSLMSEGQQKLDERHERIPDKLDRWRNMNLVKLAAMHDSEISKVREQAETRDRGFENSQSMLKAAIDTETDATLSGIAESWSKEFAPVFIGLASMEKTSLELFPAWTTEVCAKWEPPMAAPLAVRLGEIKVDLGELSEGLPSDPRFSIRGKETLTVPFALDFPDQASVMIESDGADGGAATRALSTIALRLLASHPPGRASFLFIDPVGLGKDFAGLMHLTDYEETLITNRIWTQSTHIEERLAEINDHIEKVIQMYLRDEFANITEYNKHAGTIAEKYRFIIIAGFPAAFSDTASKRLRSIASSGPRCGVHILMQRDLRLTTADSALDDELRRVCIRLSCHGGGFRLMGAPHGADEVVLDPPPSHQDSITLVHRIGRSSVDSNRVQVPFSQIAPDADEIWKFETSEELRVPVGRTGAKKLQMLAIGKGTRQHVLVAGKTGSGKSTLFHVIITNLSLWCSPNEVE
ncbi:MAG: hypothetical protein H8M99_09280, partial [Gloeobacteraceae cyanobacterium ES-bin-144]|nr:hypothetical protein [Verrucomicrobiales bacterium]